jgi:chromate reductase
MPQYRIALIIGSLRKESLNRRLANAITRMAPREFEIRESPIAALPLYNQDDDDKPAASVVRFKDEIRAAHGLLFVTPEYNRSMPGVLKNALDHASRPYGHNAFAGKPGGVIGVSIGAQGTAVAQQHLRNVLAYLDVPTLNQPEAFLHAREGFFDDAGNIGEGSRKFVQKWVDAWAEWVRRLART